MSKYKISREEKRRWRQDLCRMKREWAKRRRELYNKLPTKLRILLTFWHMRSKLYSIRYNIIKRIRPNYAKDLSTRLNYLAAKPTLNDNEIVEMSKIRHIMGGSPILKAEEYHRQVKLAKEIIDEVIAEEKRCK